MIQRSFIIFDGVGPTREQAIRAAGIANWSQFLRAGAVPGLSEKLHALLNRQVNQWRAALDRADARFFARHMPRREHWMLFAAFGDSVRYMDIETTGLSAGYHDVTVVGIHDGRRYRALVKGKGLTAAAIRHALAGCKLLVTYFGSAFDVPFLQASFPGLRFDGIPHFDLCFGGKRVGLTGGLKEVERKLGIRRARSIAEVDGFEAVRLWREYQRGSAAALKKLINYNQADTCNLAGIAPIIHARLCEQAKGTAAHKQKSH